MNVWSRLGLRARISLTLGALVLITVGGGLTMVWYTYQMEALLASVIRTDLATFRAAKGLETALLNQRGYVSYYLHEDNPDWLTELGKCRQEFNQRLEETREIDQTNVHRDLLDQIESEYKKYVADKDHVIGLYKAGKREEGARLHQKVRLHFFEILRLCEEHIRLHTEKLNLKMSQNHARAAELRLFAVIGISLALAFGILLFLLLVRQILEPIRRLALEADRSGDSDSSGNEVSTLKDRVRDLIEDADQTHTELERSQRQLLQSEKMATVGKLAAEVAHSIRNPMTSIKMRLFSLERNLDLSPTHREDLEVISEEMRQLDNIVQNFLEFSRPPKLKVQKVNVSDVVDMSLQLLQKQVEYHGIEVEQQRGHPLPEIDADPELLKEVLINLIVNACEAMDGGGRLTIKEEDAVAEHMGRAILIQVSDTGPGIPEAIRDKVLEPFFSTKEEGTGLGLAIAGRIVEEHGGELKLHSIEAKGTTFTITLPVREEEP